MWPSFLAVLAPAASLAQDEPGWLSAGEELPDEATEPTDDTEEQEPDPDEPTPSETFGMQLDLLGIETSWSGYGDLVLIYEPGETLSFDAAHFNPILSAAIGPRLWAELELEFEHAGEEILVEYGILDYTVHPGLILRMGQFLVPIGEFNEQLHPSFRWNQVSRPLMFRDVVPAVWSDVGLQARGQLRAGEAGTLRYALYVCNGLGGTLDRSLDEPIRPLRRNRRDVDLDLAVGGQTSLALLAPEPDLGVTVTASGYTGVVDQQQGLRLTIADLALSAHAGPVLLRAEGALSYLNEAPFEEGFYTQLSVDVGELTPSVRLDQVRTGLELEPVVRREASPSLLLRLGSFWTLRTEVGIPLVVAPSPRVLAMSAFYF